MKIILQKPKEHFNSQNQSQPLTLNSVSCSSQRQPMIHVTDMDLRLGNGYKDVSF